MSKTKRLNELRALQIRVHNMEIALVAMGSLLVRSEEKAIQDGVNNLLTQLFESNTAARGFTDAAMITPRTAEKDQ